MKKPEVQNLVACHFKGKRHKGEQDGEQKNRKQEQDTGYKILVQRGTGERRVKEKR
jgi:hypothetical protein